MFSIPEIILPIIPKQEKKKMMYLLYMRESLDDEYILKGHYKSLKSISTVLGKSEKTISKIRNNDILKYRGLIKITQKLV